MITTLSRSRWHPSWLCWKRGACGVRSWHSRSLGGILMRCLVMGVVVTFSIVGCGGLATDATDTTDSGTDGTGGHADAGGPAEGEDLPSADVPWEFSGILIDATQPNAGAGDKVLIIWTESSYGCSKSNALPSCTPYRDHAKLYIHLAAADLTVSSSALPFSGSISQTGPNLGAPDSCWSGLGGLAGDIEIKSISTDTMVVRLSNLDVFYEEMRHVLQSQDISVVDCSL